MRLLHRYIFFQVLGACLLALGLFIFVLVIGNALRDIIGLMAGGRLGLGDFLYFVGLLIPGVAAYALPLGLLMGILLVLGRLSAQNEIQAMKSAGISLYSIVAPIFLIALIGTVFCLLVTFKYGPHANVAYRQGVADIIRNDPLRFIQPGVFINDFPGYILYVGERSGPDLRDFWIWELDEQSRASVLLRAENGTFVYDVGQDALVLTLLDGTAEKRDDNDPENFARQETGTLAFEELSVRLALDDILGGRNRSTKLSFMTLGQLRQQHQMYLSRPEGMTQEQAYAGQIAVQTQVQKNFTSSLAILSLASIAIPLGIKASRTETLANLGIALALALGYYMLVICISYLETMPHLRPDLLIWVPNLTLQALGIVLLRRANR